MRETTRRPSGGTKPIWPRDFRKFMAWIFLAWSPLGLEQTIRFLSVQGTALQGYRGILGGPIFSAVAAIVCVVAWWKIRREARWARGWGIAASLTNIAIFIRPFVVPLGRPVWGPMFALPIGVVGLVVFLRPDIWADAESLSRLRG